MALSKTKEISNLACIARIVCGPCTDILRKILTNQISPSKLKARCWYFFQHTDINNYTVHLITRTLFHVEYSESYSGFDISLLYFFLRWICDIPPHKKKWGHSPIKDDRSLSANIERIYNMQKKYKHFADDSLKNSTFEKHWEKLFQTVKELEEDIGSGTTNQDAMKKLKSCSMDPDVQNLFIEKLRLGSMFVGYGNPEQLYSSGYLNMMPVTKEDIQVLASRTIEFIIDHSDEFGQPLGQQHLTEGAIRPLDTASKRFEKITSRKLKELLSSFKIEFPADVPEKKSFASKILENDTLNLVTAIKSLSDEIVLTMKKHENYPSSPQYEAYVFEIDVVYDENGDQSCVFRKDTSLNELYQMEKDTRVAVMLIRSEFLPVVSSKLLVYKNFKHVITEKKIFLQHEYEEFDNVAKLIAFRILSLFCSSIESVIHAFTIALCEKIMTDDPTKMLTAKQIKDLCSGVFQRTGYGPFGSNRRGSNWPSLVSVYVKEQLPKEDIEQESAWSKIQSTCQKTVEDLKTILKDLESFQTKYLQVDQERHIEELLKSEVIEDMELLKYPSVIKYIAGYKDDKKEVVKVYLSNDNDDVKKEFIKSCKGHVSKDTCFEFVNFEKTKETPKKIENVKLPDSTSVDEITREQVMFIIQKHREKIFARYSNVIGIRDGKVRQMGNEMRERHCIILYCLDNTLIPFGEEPLPDSIENCPCSVREDFLMLGKCPEDCPPTNKNMPEPGCSIGQPSREFSGSVGFLYESADTEKYGSGFLTASHVAIENYLKMVFKSKLLSEHKLGKKPHFIVHPSWPDNQQRDNEVGKVVEAFFGNYKSFDELSKGLDFAAVKILEDSGRQGEKETLSIFKGDLTLPIKVTKTGRSTGTTYGYLIKSSMDFRFEIDPPKKPYLIFYDAYVVEDEPEKKCFFEKGDSGSGVFVVGTETKSDEVLGIGIARSLEFPETFVCKIDKILNKLDLTLVRYQKENHH